MGRVWRVMLMTVLLALGSISAAGAASAGQNYVHLLNSLPHVGGWVTDMPGYTSLLLRKGYVFEEFHGVQGGIRYDESIDGAGRIASLSLEPRSSISLSPEETASIIHKLSVSYGRPDTSQGDRLIWDGTRGVQGYFDTRSGSLQLRLK